MAASRRLPKNGAGAGAANRDVEYHDPTLRSRATSWTASDSCGCAMSARFLAVALLAAIAWYAWHWRSLSLSVWALALRTLLWMFFAGTVGKVIGILVFRTRARRRSA